MLRSWWLPWFIILCSCSASGGPVEELRWLEYGQRLLPRRWGSGSGFGLREIGLTAAPEIQYLWKIRIFTIWSL